jgi:hypothetical protein
LSVAGGNLFALPTEPVTYCPNQRPDVEVHVDGTWHRGELRAWVKRARTGWVAAAYRTAPSMQYYDTIPAERVRADERTER